MSQFIQNGSALMGLTRSSVPQSLHGGKIQNQVMQKRIIPPVEGARLLVEPNGQTMTLNAVNRPCMEACTQNLDDEGSQCHHMAGTSCPTPGCSSVGWLVFGGSTGDREKRIPSLRHFSIINLPAEQSQITHPYPPSCEDVQNTSLLCRNWVSSSP